MNIWPNPFMNDLHLNHQIHEDKRATPLNIEIYNSIGSLFLKQTVVQTDDIILHLEELPNGYYVLKCSDDRNLFVSPIVKQNFGFE
ncbi:MAG: T9SS type A sorting domain-containing protein [Bacteroidetes bacterium]|nr:T9SS type A sorting domain-containing protein [Bacteroidota bacterium]